MLGGGVNEAVLRVAYLFATVRLRWYDAELVSSIHD